MSFKSSGVHPAGCIRPVLLVDDNEDIREMMREALELVDHHVVVTASNGQEALDIIQAGEVPAVMVVDLTMPVMSGWELIRILRGDRVLARIPIIVVSASYRPSDPIDADRVLRKPVLPEDLARLVDELCPWCARMRRKRTSAAPA